VTQQFWKIGRILSNIFTTTYFGYTCGECANLIELPEGVDPSATPNEDRILKWVKTGQ